MPQHDFPLVSTELLAALEAAYPSKAPGIDTPDRKIWWDAGARSVVEFLKTKHKQQFERTMTKGQ